MTKQLLKISKYKPSIFQGKLDFASGHHGISLSIEHPLERTIVRALIAILIALMCGYLYFVSASVLNVMARKEALGHIAKLQGTIGGSEQQYFTLSHAISPSAGASLGLRPLAKTQYVYRPGNVGTAAATIARNDI